MRDVPGIEVWDPMVVGSEIVRAARRSATRRCVSSGCPSAPSGSGAGATDAGSLLRRRRRRVLGARGAHRRRRSRARSSRDEDPVGQEILIGSVPFRVIGVLESFGTDIHGMDRDNEVVVPITTAMRRVLNVDSIRAAKLLVSDRRGRRSRDARGRARAARATRLSPRASPTTSRSSPPWPFGRWWGESSASCSSTCRSSPRPSLLAAHGRGGEPHARHRVNERRRRDRSAARGRRAVRATSACSSWSRPRSRRSAVGSPGLSLGGAVAVQVARRFGLGRAVDSRPWHGRCWASGLSLAHGSARPACCPRVARRASIRRTPCDEARRDCLRTLGCGRCSPTGCALRWRPASVAIGVAAVLVTSALGQGARDAVLRDVGDHGDEPARGPAGAGRGSRGSPGDPRAVVTSLRLDDCEAIATLAPSVARPPRRRAAAAGQGRARLACRRSSWARAPRSSLAARPAPARGRFLDAERRMHGASVSPCSARVSPRRSSRGATPVGETLRIRGVPVRDRRRPRRARRPGRRIGRGRQRLRARPHGAAPSASTRPGSASVFVSACAAPTAGRRPRQQIRRLLRERHRICRTAAGRLRRPEPGAAPRHARRRWPTRSRSSPAGLAGASLLVGGTGILALMLLSVKERTAEIGLRMAVGRAAARRPPPVPRARRRCSRSAGGSLGARCAVVAGGRRLARATDWPVGLAVAGAALQPPRHGRRRGSASGPCRPARRRGCRRSSALRARRP